MEKDIRSSDVSTRRLDRAIRHVSDLWFPASPELLKKIQDEFEKGSYKENRVQFYHDVKQDFSLFFYCLKRLSDLLPEGSGQSEQLLQDPVKLFEHVDYECLRELLEIEITSLTRHSFSETGRLQAQRMQEAAISAATAQTLAPHHELAAEVGFTGALIRQLGLTLIAFNYPSAYEEELAILTPGESFDARIAMRLGFSPMLLAHTMLKRWGYDAEHILTDDEMITRASGATLQKICEVGESLARANFPESYPDSSHHWDVAREEIERQLGKKGLQAIKVALKENTRNLVKLSPAIFHGGIVLDPEMQIATYWDEHHLRKNPFLAGCAKPFRTKMHKFYETILRETVSQDALGVLVKEMIPLSGFENGCVFTIDPSTCLLIPQLRIGQVKLRTLEPVNTAAIDDIVSEAFETLSPVTHYESDSKGDQIAHLAGVIGFSQRIGVLYLEMSATRYTRSEVDFEAHFRSLCKAFSDTFNLN
jgi:hypothetical protein